MTRLWCAFACSFLLIACGGSAHPPGDAGRDASPDAPGADASPDGSRRDGGRDATQDAMGDGSVDGGVAVHCREPSECVLAISDCCGPCGRPSLADYDAIHVSEQEAHRMMVCTDPDPICPGCAAMPNPNLGATCARDTGRCEGFDLERHDVSVCRRDDDCIVRVPDCCACGADTSPYRLVALNRTKVGDFTAMVCDSTAVCAACEPTYPANVEAYCDDASGRCRVRMLVD